MSGNRWAPLAVALTLLALLMCPACAFVTMPLGTRPLRLSARAGSRRPHFVSAPVSHFAAWKPVAGGKLCLRGAPVVELRAFGALCSRAKAEDDEVEQARSSDALLQAETWQREEPSAIEDDSDELFLSGTAFELVLAAVGVAVGKALGLSALGAGFDLSPASLAAGLLWTLPPLAFVGGIRILDLKSLKEIEKITEEFARRLFLGRPNAQLALFCFAAGFGEELLFRGVLHQNLELLFGFMPAAITVGIAFGLAHNLTPTYFIISALSSCLFSLMFWASGSNIVVPVVAHATYDFIALKLTLNDIASKDQSSLRS